MDYVAKRQRICHPGFQGVTVQGHWAFVSMALIEISANGKGGSVGTIKSGYQSVETLQE